MTSAPVPVTVTLEVEAGIALATAKAVESEAQHFMETEEANTGLMPVTVAVPTDNVTRPVIIRVVVALIIEFAQVVVVPQVSSVGTPPFGKQVRGDAMVE